MHSASSRLHFQFYMYKTRPNFLYFYNSDYSGSICDQCPYKKRIGSIMFKNSQKDGAWAMKLPEQ